MSITKLNSLKEQVNKRLEDLQNLVAKKYGKTVPNMEVTYDLTSIRTAGMAVTQPYLNKFKIRLHPAALLTYGKDYIEDTVVHEFAHLVQKQHYPTSQPHGIEWKRVMVSLGKDPKRCHNMDLTSAITTYNSSVKGSTSTVTPIKKRNVKTFSYHCKCRNHELTSIRHNKVLKGENYICKTCGTRLVRS